MARRRPASGHRFSHFTFSDFHIFRWPPQLAVGLFSWVAVEIDTRSRNGRGKFSEVTCKDAIIKFRVGGHPSRSLRAPTSPTNY